MKNFKIVLAFLGLAFIWGGAFIAIKVVVTDIPPLHATMIRMWIAVPYLWLIFKVLGKPLHVPKALWVRSWIAGLFMIGIPYCLVFWGETKVVAGIGGIINGTVPLFTAALTALPFSPYHDRKQRLGWKVVVGLLSGFIGLLIIFSPSLHESGAKNDLWAVIAIVGMSICYSLSNVMNARILAPPHKISITGNVFHQHAASLVFLTALVPFLEPVAFDYSQILAPRVLTSLLFLGIISGATSLLIYYYLIREIGAVKTSAITYLIPIGAVILDLLILGTEPHWTAIAGAAFILVGVLSIRRAPRSG